MDPKPIEAFGASLQGYYNNKCLSDVVIRCNGQEFAVHSLVLFCHSDYFKKQLTETWKSADKIIEITDFDTNIVEAMLRFIYSFDCDVRPNTPPLIFHAKVYQIGDKYGIETLKKQASNKVERIVNEAEVATKYVSDLVDAITVMYTTTPPGDRGLRDIVLMPQNPFKEGLAMIGDFSANLLSFMHENWEEYCECECFACKTTFTLKIDSLSGKYQVFHSPNPVFCPVCGSKPPSSSRDSD
ncbi:BTB/POZ protein [Fusarium oxysporum II5]|nr:BTB/POZ protein [Fusarium oxysporum II5]